MLIAFYGVIIMQSVNLVIFSALIRRIRRLEERG